MNTLLILPAKHHIISPEYRIKDVMLSLNDGAVPEPALHTSIISAKSRHFIKTNSNTESLRPPPGLGANQGQI
jgi:hypothetical protein